MCSEPAPRKAPRAAQNFSSSRQLASCAQILQPHHSLGAHPWYDHLPPTSHAAVIRLNETRSWERLLLTEMPPDA